jgi:methionyl-tRNA formyltransferase
MANLALGRLNSQSSSLIIALALSGATGNAPLEILEIQPAGKRSMPASDFLRGCPIQLGDRLE